MSNLPSTDLVRTYIVPRVSPDLMNTVRLYLTQMTRGRDGRSTFLPELPAPATLSRLRRAAEHAHAALRSIDLASAEKQKARALIASLFVGRHLKDDPAGLVATYLTHLKDLPLFAIEAAVEDYKTGNAAAQKAECSPAFAPTWAQLFQLGDAHRRELAAQHDSICDVIEAKLLPPPPPRPLSADVAAQRMGGVLKNMEIETEQDKQRRAYLDEEARKRNDASVISDYCRNGIEPFYSRGGALVSLPFARQMEAQGVLELVKIGGKTSFAVTKKDGGDDGESE